MRLWIALLLAVFGAVQVRAGMLSDSSLYYCKCECPVVAGGAVWSRCLAFRQWSLRYGEEQPFICWFGLLKHGASGVA